MPRRRPSRRVPQAPKRDRPRGRVPNPVCACGKRAYLTREEATSILGVIRLHAHRTRPDESPPRRVYPCRESGTEYWHLTSVPLRKYLANEVEREQERG